MYLLKLLLHLDKRKTTWLVLPVMAIALAGCTGPTIREQRLVSKPNMQFSDSPTLTYNSSRLLTQLQTGAATSGGAQNAGCTSCR